MGSGGGAELSSELASDAQLAEWMEKFREYRKAPSREVLLEWLARFDEAHRKTAHKILDAVIVVSEMEIQRNYLTASQSLEGWSKERAQRKGRWYFVGVGGAGESGPAMLRLFREANGMQDNKWQSLFVSMRDLPALSLSAFDSVVFIDDFAGSGNQITGFWPTMQELVASEAKCYLVLSAVTEKAKAAIAEKTELHLVSSIELSNADNIFDPSCSKFDAEDRAAIEGYGKIAWKPWPRGYDDCGLTFVLSHKTPNNTIPILHANHEKWVGPFPRSLIAA